MKRLFQKMNKKAVVLVALCICLTLCTVGSVWAYLVTKTDTISNRFVPAHISCRVVETFQGGVKSDVMIQNTGNADAYIRAVVVATFVDADGKVLAISPEEGVDYTVEWATNGWTLGSDGFWYYADPVKPNAFTTHLVETAVQITAPEHYTLNLQIVASAIQADPPAAVQSAWGITPVNGKLIPN